MKTGIRNIYMDILKIISMFMVVLLHATNFGIQNINRIYKLFYRLDHTYFFNGSS